MSEAAMIQPIAAYRYATQAGPQVNKIDKMDCLCQLGGIFRVPPDLVARDFPALIRGRR